MNSNRTRIATQPQETLPTQLRGILDMVKTVQPVSTATSNLNRLNASQPITSPSDFGSMLKVSRKKKGLSQQEFADLAGVGRRFVSECEAGKPRLEFAKVLQVAAAVGIDLFAIKR